MNKKECLALVGVAQLGGALSQGLKGHGFDSQSGHKPRLQVWSLVKEYEKATSQCFSFLSMPVCLSVSLSPHPLPYSLKK